jgi:hypothetical protein
MAPFIPSAHHRHVTSDSAASSAVLPRSSLDSRRHRTSAIRVSPAVVEAAGADVGQVFARLDTRPAGLTAAEAGVRLEQYDRNVLAT